MRNSNPLLKLFGAASLLVAMVLMTGCAGDPQNSSKSLSIGAGITLTGDTTGGATDTKETKTESCCSKTGTKPANVKNECATPNSAGGSCCAKTKAAATTCDCTDCKCCKACKGDGKCECTDCKCCAACKTKKAAAAQTFGKPANVKEECSTPNSAGGSCCAKTKAAATKCDCTDCKCCKACKGDGKCECADCKCCASCKTKKAAAVAPAGAAVSKCDCTDCKCCKACKTGGKCECVDCKCCKNCKEKTATDLLLPSPGPAKR